MMAYRTQTLFRDDSYLRTAEAEVVAVNERGGIILDRTIFYATSSLSPPPLPARPRTRSSTCRHQTSPCPSPARS